MVVCWCQATFRTLKTKIFHRTSQIPCVLPHFCPASALWHPELSHKTKCLQQPLQLSCLLFPPWLLLSSLYPRHPLHIPGFSHCSRKPTLCCPRLLQILSPLLGSFDSCPKEACPDLRVWNRPLCHCPQPAVLPLWWSCHRGITRWRSASSAEMEGSLGSKHILLLTAAHSAPRSSLGHDYHSVKSC